MAASSSAPPTPPWTPGEQPTPPPWDPDVEAEGSRHAKISHSSSVAPTNVLLEVPLARHGAAVRVDHQEAGDLCAVSTWLCRGYQLLLLALSMALVALTVVAGLYAGSRKAALVAVVLLSLLGPLAIWALQGVTYCSRDFTRREGDSWFISGGSTFSIVLMIVMISTHLVVVVTGPNSLRNWRSLEEGEMFSGSIRDPEAFTGKYRFFNFTESAMFYPGTAYASATGRTLPSPLNEEYRYACGKYVSRPFCGTPLVPLDYNLGEPVSVFAGCAGVCGEKDNCHQIITRTSSARPDCFNQLGKTGYGDPVYSYTHLANQIGFRGAAGQLGVKIATRVLYIRITSVEHVEAKARRYKRYGIIVEASVFGAFFGLALIVMLIVFAASAC